MKKITALLLVLAMIFVLVGCATNSERYQSAMLLIMGEPWQEPEPEPDPLPEPEPEPQVEQYAEWPKDLPAVTDAEAEYLWFYAEEEFYAAFLMTSVQRIRWENSLKSAGFAGDPPAKDNMVAEYESMLTELDGSLYYVRIHFYYVPISDFAWPAEFAVFPEFRGVGQVLSSNITTENTALVLNLISVNETQAAVNAYVSQLTAGGFIDVGYGMYVKESGGMMYEFSTDGIFINETTSSMFWRIYPVT